MGEISYNSGEQETMEKEPVIRSLTVRNLLSFGDSPQTIELKNLNVLIGANGSGKSNLIEVIGLLQSAPKELATAINNGGGVDEWLWKGAAKTPTASVRAIVIQDLCAVPLLYRIDFTKVGFRFQIAGELVMTGEVRSDIIFAYQDGRPVLSYQGAMRSLREGEFNPQLSILAQRKDPEYYPEITHLGDLFSKFRLYRDWEFGGVADVREPCDAYLPNDFLEDDASNLGVVLDQLLSQPKVKHDLIEHLRTFYHGAKDLRTRNDAGKIQTLIEEEGLGATIPLIRMSHGTVRWLALLSILLHPAPPPLVCIEEPELGLHPDIIPELAKLLVEASTRTQLIVTTHSEALIEEFTEMADAVLVCEKEDGVSTFRRLDPGQLSEWLKDYSLGQLWRKGQIGGNRW